MVMGGDYFFIFKSVRQRRLYMRNARAISKFVENYGNAPPL